MDTYEVCWKPIIVADSEKLRDRSISSTSSIPWLSGRVTASYLQNKKILIRSKYKTTLHKTIFDQLFYPQDINYPPTLQSNSRFHLNYPVSIFWSMYCEMWHQHVKMSQQCCRLCVQWLTNNNANMRLMNVKKMRLTWPVIFPWGAQSDQVHL